jgi:glycosyltransferase involved in cell wall biosynthesis
VTRPRVTLVTPSFNQGEFLDETIRSVLDQDYGDIEYLVVDGGSTDESVEIIRRYEDRLAWWASEQDAGQVDALRKGFERATGSLLGWLNSDDVLLPGAVSAVVDAFDDAPEALLIYGDNVLIDERSQEIGPLPARPFDVREMVRTMQNHVPQPGSLFQRRAIDLAPLNAEGYYYFDFEFVLALGLLGPVERISRAVGGYRLHNVSKSVSEPLRKADDQLRVADAIFAQASLPASVRAVEHEARARAQLTAAEYFYAAGAHRRALAGVLRSVRLAPAAVLPRAASVGLRAMLPPRVARALRMRRASGAPSAPS